MKNQQSYMETNDKNVSSNQKESQVGHGRDKHQDMDVNKKRHSNKEKGNK